MNNFSLTPSKYLSEAEQTHLEAILERFRTVAMRNTTMLMFMLKTGARPSEVLGVTWADIDFQKKTVFIDTLKGGPPRVIPLSENLIVRLQSLPIGPGKVFDISYTHFCRIWHEYRPARKKLHSLRHTFAVNCYNKSGYNLRLVQQALGHTALQTTAIYLEIQSTTEDLRLVVN